MLDNASLFNGEEEGLFFESLGSDLIFINIKLIKVEGKKMFEAKINGEHINEDGMFETMSKAKKACFTDVKERLAMCKDDLKRLKK